MAKYESFKTFFYDASQNAVFGQREQDIPFKIVDGSLNELVIVTLSDGLKDTIANFITKGRVQKVDYNLLPEPYKTYATNKSIYYIEVIPIDLSINKTYGTVAMAFSHQLGLGLNTPYNKLITPALYDRGVYSPNYGTLWVKQRNSVHGTQVPVYVSGLSTHKDDFELGHREPQTLENTQVIGLLDNKTRVIANNNLICGQLYNSIIEPITHAHPSLVTGAIEYG